MKRRLKKWLYGSCPGIAGAFPYFGARIHFPKGSIVFEAACAQGIYEPANVKAMQILARDDSWVLDIGANIGLMSVPVLAARPGVRVISVEASPGTAQFLSKTRDASTYRDRWELVFKAMGSAAGTASFHVGAPEAGAYDGLQPTGRAAAENVVSVEVTTVDLEWARRGRPDISVIKIDVEGAEYDVLQGAKACIAQCRPAMIVEWGPRNIGAYDRSMNDLLIVACQLGYRVWALPHLAEICDPVALQVHASVTESYLMFPDAQG